MATSALEKEIAQLELESKIINQKARANYLEQVSDIKERVKQIGDEASQKAKQVVDRVGEYINQNPQKAALIGLGIGVGLGLVLGLLVRRRKNDD